MADEVEDPRSFIEQVLALLDDRFPWLGSGEGEAVSGADTVDQLTDLYQSLRRQRSVRATDPEQEN